MLCDLYNVSVLKFRKRSKKQMKKERRKREGEYEGGKKGEGREGMKNRFISCSTWGKRQVALFLEDVTELQSLAWL